MATKEVTDASFDTDVLGADTPVLVDFWAEWCGPCKQIGPALEELAGEYAGKLTIAKINIDDNPQTPGKFGVRGIPTLMTFKGLISLRRLLFVLVAAGLTACGQEGPPRPDNMCPSGGAYARVDAIVHDDRLTLMEVELVEPELFFTLRPNAAAHLATIVLGAA